MNLFPPFPDAPEAPSPGRMPEVRVNGAPVKPSAFALLCLFMKEAATSFRQMGTFLPAQGHLARKISETVPRRDGITIMELGAGEGSLTRALVRRLDGLAYRLLVIELSRPLLEANRRAIDLRLSQPEDPAKRGQLYFVQGDALAFEKALERFGLNRVDTVVSSLPLHYFSRRQRFRLFRSVRKTIGPDGVFVQYRYTPSGVGELTRFFGQVRRRFVLNVMPAWMFVCDAADAPGSAVGSVQDPAAGSANVSGDEEPMEARTVMRAVHANAPAVGRSGFPGLPGR